MDNNSDLIIKKFKKVKQYRRQLIKSAILSGKEHETHISKKIISSKKSCFTFQCKCKCYLKLTDEQIRYHLINIMQLKVMLNNIPI